MSPLPCFDFYYTNYRYSSFLSPLASANVHQLRAHDVVLAFKEWFKSRERYVRPSMDSIYVILNNTDDAVIIDSELSKLNLRLNERFVLDVLNSGDDVLSCLKFFDWAGRQRGFVHTRATFYAIFKILSKAKLMTLMTDFLDSYRKESGICKTRFYNTLVMGYAVAGKPDVALRLFGKMRFHGLDLDEYCYHVLLNALVEQSCFDAFDMVAKQIEFRGLQNSVTHAVLVKGLCKKKEWDRAETYTRDLMKSGMGLSEAVIGTLVAGLCKDKMFERAAEVVEEFGGSKVPLQAAYNMWIRDRSITPHTKFESIVYILKKEEGGRHSPFFTGYRPQFYMRTTDVTGKVTAIKNEKDEESKMVMPGDRVKMVVELIVPVACEQGMRFAIREGGKTVGAGVINAIIE